MSEKAKYWYKNFIQECPVCGRGRQWKERQYTPAPPRYDQSRWDYDGWAYDGCLL